MGYDVVVIGGGVIGLAAAWKIAVRGMAVAVVDPEPGRGASWAAAGMLAPVSEVHHGEEPLLALALESARRWPAFAAALAADVGRPIGYRTEGTLVVAADDGDRAWVEELYQFQRALGLGVQWLTGRRARELEPDLAPGVRAAIWVPGDHQVDNRLLVGALLVAVRRAGVAGPPGPGGRRRVHGRVGVGRASRRRDRPSCRDRRPGRGELVGPGRRGARRRRSGAAGEGADPASVA